MGNSLRCCLACVIPCGALDLIRIVHLNGTVEEFAGRVTAGEVLRSNPGHVLTKPSSSLDVDVRRIIVVSADSELKKGGIYFLIPDPSLNGKKKTQALDVDRSHQRRMQTVSSKKHRSKIGVDLDGDVIVVPEKKSKSSRRSRRSSGRVSDHWTPCLESISEA